MQDDDDIPDNEEMEELKRVASRMSSKHQPSHASNLNAATLPILPWLAPGAVHLPSGVEEVCDSRKLLNSVTYRGHSTLNMMWCAIKVDFGSKLLPRKPTYSKCS